MPDRTPPGLGNAVWHQREIVDQPIPVHDILHRERVCGYDQGSADAICKCLLLLRGAFNKGVLLHGL